MNWADKQVELLKKGFVVKDCEIGGTDCVLIYPSKSATFEIKWDKDLAKYRSSIWTKEHGIPVSLGLPKFFNWGEREDYCAPPESLADAVAVGKEDGSLLIVSKFNDELIIRTRGTSDARKLENGSEIDDLIESYPFAFDNQLVNSEQKSVLYEWVTPTNRIILDYGPVPRLFLVGVINHADYKLSKQSVLDGMAPMIMVERPETHTFGSISELIETVQAFKDKEGICIYFGKDQQNILKVKGTDYLAKHAFKSHCSFNSVIDMFLERGRPTYTEFIRQLTDEFDWECVQFASGIVSTVCDANKTVNKMIDHMESFVAPLRLKSRKDAALAIQAAYGKTTRGGYVFKVLDKQPFNDIMYRKLLHQICKEEVE